MGVVLAPKHMSLANESKPDSRPGRHCVDLLHRLQNGACYSPMRFFSIVPIAYHIRGRFVQYNRSLFFYDFEAALHQSALHDGDGGGGQVGMSTPRMQHKKMMFLKKRTLPIYGSLLCILLHSHATKKNIFSWSCPMMIIVLFNDTPIPANIKVIS